MECIQIISGDVAMEIDVDIEIELTAHYEPGQRGGRFAECIPERIVIEGARRVHDLIIDGRVSEPAGSEVDLSADDVRRLSAQIMEGRHEP